MNRRRVGFWMVVAAVMVLPSTALAEVSVQLDSSGHYKRFFYLTVGKGRNAIVWKQVRPGLSPDLVLNPLGDTYQDGRPVIRVSPVTGYPWVVWTRNFGNIRQLAFSYWDGRRWTEPALVNPGQPLLYDDREPALAFDAAGHPFVVWTRYEQTPKILLSTMIQGQWSPGLVLSEPEVASRAASIVLQGSTAVVTYSTQAGPVTRTYEAAVLVDSAAKLMDNPIPPLNSPPGPGGDSPGGVGGGPGDSIHRR